MVCTTADAVGQIVLTTGGRAFHNVIALVGVGGGAVRKVSNISAHFFAHNRSPS